MRGEDLDNTFERGPVPVPVSMIVRTTDEVGAGTSVSKNGLFMLSFGGFWSCLHDLFLSLSVSVFLLSLLLKFLVLFFEWKMGED